MQASHWDNMKSELIFRVEAPVDPSMPSFTVGDAGQGDPEELQRLLREIPSTGAVFNWVPEHSALWVNTSENPGVWLTVEVWGGPPPQESTVTWQVESSTVWNRVEELAVSETGTGRWPLAEVTFNWLPSGPYTVRCRGFGRAEDPMMEIADDGQDRYLLQLWPVTTDS
ncbi:hypothetical protein [Actinomadura pelletieri]|uniref:hypothetical protein n=1 Tax=Actinomadura pelletieri TaxID=111805 RepID=UPI0011C3ED6F|nr:hypothetical protein [Actinomadura pelletieri]